MNPIEKAVAAFEEFARVMERVRADAEAYLRAHGVEPNPRIPILDQAAEVERQIAESQP